MTRQARVPGRYRNRIAVFSPMVGVLASWWLAACSRDESPLPYADWLGRGIPPPSDELVLRGQPCGHAGQTVECGEVTDRRMGYAVCALGERQCVAGVWGPCIRTGLRSLQTLGRRLMTVGESSICEWNVCNRHCYEIDNSPGQMAQDGDVGVVVTDGGLTLPLRTAGLESEPGCAQLVLEASPADLTVTESESESESEPVAESKLTAVVLPEDCRPDWPGPVSWGVDRHERAHIDQDGRLTLLKPIAGPIEVTAYAGDLSAAIEVRVSADLQEPPQVPPEMAAGFEGPIEQTDTARVLYPYRNTVFPLGLSAPLVQWVPGDVGRAEAIRLTLRSYHSGQLLFRWSRISPEESSVRLGESVELAEAPRFQIPQRAWQLLEQSAAGQDAEIVLQRCVDSRLHSEVVVPVRFATERLGGILHYQAFGTGRVENSAELTYSDQAWGGNRRFGVAVMSIRPGDQAPTVAMGHSSYRSAQDASSDAGCRGCHTGSLDGSLLMANIGTRPLRDSEFRWRPRSAAEWQTIAPVANQGVLAWGAVHPSGDFLFANTGPSDNIHSGVSPGGLTGSAGAVEPGLYTLPPHTLPGTQLESQGLPKGLQAAMPMFSPDGTQLVFNHYAGTVAGTTGDRRSLALLDFDVASRTFSGFRQLVVAAPATPCDPRLHPTEPCTHVWPTFLPAGAGVVYEREVFHNGSQLPSSDPRRYSDFGGTRASCSEADESCGSTGARGELWWVTTRDPPKPIPLAAANGWASDGTVAIPTARAAGHSVLDEPLLSYQPSASPRDYGGYHWVAFTSRRLYGNVATVNPWWSDPRTYPIAGELGPTTKKIWVAALDPEPEPGTDPSHPAFLLP
ncbi:hypothetical protein ACFL5O_09075, partial [Myxococcota bacterium]